jgi:hypothetical protein
MLVLVGFTLLLKGFGYVVAAFFLMFGMLSVYDPSRWRIHLFSAAGAALLSFLVFHTWLGVQFPRGSIITLGW